MSGRYMCMCVSEAFRPVWDAVASQQLAKAEWHLVPHYNPLMAPPLSARHTSTSAQPEGTQQHASPHPVHAQGKVCV